MPTEFQIETEQPGEGIVVACPVGEVDLASSPALRTRLSQIISESPKKLILDLSRVPYMDSSGVATLVEALQMTNRSGVRLALYGMQERVRSIFEIARLDTVFKITETFEQARED